MCWVTGDVCGEGGDPGKVRCMFGGIMKLFDGWGRRSKICIKFVRRKIIVISPLLSREQNDWVRRASEGEIRRAEATLAIWSCHGELRFSQGLWVAGDDKP